MSLRTRIAALTELLEPDQDVLGLVLIGSFAASDVKPDEWSDIDFVLVVGDAAFRRFYPETGWVARLGDPYAFSQSGNEFFGVTRVHLSDGRRVDFVIVPESSLDRVGEWASNPLRWQKQCLFSRSAALDRVLARTFPPYAPMPVSRDQIERMANDLRFKGMLAVGKCARNELLVALHLSLDMIRDCLVLAMMLRDRETGTDHHTDGSRGNQFVAELEDTRRPYTAEGILDSIERSAIAFDSLAARLVDGYEEGRGPLVKMVERARKGHSTVGR